MGPGLLAALLVACEPQMRGYDGAPIGCGPGSTMVAEICIATPLMWLPAIIVLIVSVLWWIRVASWMRSVETALERIAEQTKKP